MAKKKPNVIGYVDAEGNFQNSMPSTSKQVSTIKAGNNTTYKKKTVSTNDIRTVKTNENNDIRTIKTEDTKKQDDVKTAIKKYGEAIKDSKVKNDGFNLSNAITDVANIYDAKKNIAKSIPVIGKVYDATDKALNTTENIATNMGTGALKTLEGVGKAASDLAFNPVERNYNYAYDLLTKGKKVADENYKDLLKMQQRDLKKNMTESFQKKTGYSDIVDERENNSLVKRDNFGGNFFQGLGGMVPALVLGGALGGSPELTNLSNLTGKEKAVAALNNIGKTYAAQLPSTLTMGASSYGSGVEEALNSGASMNKARAYGLLNAAIEEGTEMMTGGIPGLEGMGGIDSFVEPFIDKTSKGYINALLKALYGATGEGLEEVASTYLDALSKRALLGENINWNDVNNEAKQSFLLGSLMGGVLNSPSNIQEFQDVKNKKQASQGVQNENNNNINDNNISNTNQIREIIEQKENGQIDVEEANNRIAEVQNGTYEQNRVAERTLQQAEQQFNEVNRAEATGQIDSETANLERQALTNTVNQMTQQEEVQEEKKTSPVDLLSNKEKQTLNKIYEKQANKQPLSKNDRDTLERFRRRQRNNAEIEQRKEQGLKNPELKIPNSYNDVRDDYGKYYSNADMSKFNSKIADKAAKTIQGNRYGRTKQQWYDLAKNIGMQADNMDSESLKKYAFASYKYFTPNQSINRQGNKNNNAQIHEWVRAVYEGARVGQQVETKTQQVKQEVKQEIKQEPKQVETKQEVQRQLKPTNTEDKIQNFRNSVENENIKDKDGFYKAVEKIIKDKDYNVILDSSITNDKGQSVNALITNENGTTIKINPKSERAGEILLMHEVTHGIETKEMRKLILDYAKKNPEFNDALENLKKIYGTEDVTPEVVADISGQLLGNQEFINSLSLEKPTLFKRILDALTSLRNKLTGNSKYENFVKDLEVKWSKAYREANQNTFNKSLKESAMYSQNAQITDNQGRTLTKDQVDFYKDTKVVDDEGHLITVYHTTSDEINPFYTFDPRGTENYQYGDDIVIFTTDDATMSGGYAGENKLKKVDTSKNADTNQKSAWRYEMYMNIKNPYIIDCEGRMYQNAVVEFTNEINNLFKDVEKYKEELNELAKESEKRFINSQSGGSYMDIRLSNSLYKNIDNELISDTNLEELTDYKDFYEKATKEGYDLPSPDTQLEDIMYDPDEVDYLYEQYGEKRVDKYLEMTIEDFINKTSEGQIEYKEESTWFKREYQKIIGDILEQAGETEPDNVLLKHVSTFSGEDWYRIAKGMFTDTAKKNNAPLKYQYNTNQIVKYIINENKTNLQKEKYDGVIFKNIIDVATDFMDFGKYKPANVYVAFNQNQVKAVDNKTPTSNPDIRYSKEGKKWQEFLDKYFQARGTRTQLNDNKEITATGPNNQEVKLKEKNGVYTRQDVVNEVKNIENQFKNQTLKAKNGEKVSNFYSNLTEKSKFIEPETRESLKSERSIKFYKSVTNEQALQEAVDIIGTTPASQARALNNFLTKQDQFTATDMAEGWVFLKQYQDVGNYDAMASVAKKMREMGTKSGQAIQMLGLEARLTPEGMYRFAVNELAQAEEKYNKEKGRTKKDIEQHRKNFQLTPEETEFIKSQMEKVQGMEEGRARDIEVAKINKMLTDKLPHTKGQSLKAWMRLSMLFNPKTQVRNIAGNALITPVNALSDVASGAVDRMVAKKTGARTIGGPSLGGLASYVKGGVKGVGEAWQDYRMGIDTRNVNQDRFDIGQGKQFNEQHRGPLKGVRNKIAKLGNKTNDLLAFVMDAGDRFFYQGSLENSLYNQQKLNKTKEITKDMYDLAENEGLQRTWNDNNQFTKAVLNIRKAINDIGGLMHVKVGDYGLGDLMIPFAKTPANLTKAIVDYSPAGFLTSITEGRNLKRAIETGNYTLQQQHDFSQSVGKATAGTLLYALGIALAKAKITTGDSDEDKDLKNFMRYNLGIQPYSIKIGNKSFTYDWAQPVAAPFAITADIEKGVNEEMTPAQAIQQFLTTGFNILTEQSFLSGINEVLNDNDGLLHGIEQQVINMPATAVPTLLKQFTDMIDATKRQTYSKEGMTENSKKYAQSKLPTESKKLAPQVDVLGNEIQKYGGDNNAFNVFLNPSNTEKGKSNDVSKEIYALYEATGDKTIIPKKVDYTITKDGKKKVLTTKEMEKWQKASGRYVTDNVRKAMNTPKYQRMSDVDKATVINKIVNYSYMKAKSETFDIPMSSYYSSINKAESKGIPMYDYYISKIKEDKK